MKKTPVLTMALYGVELPDPTAAPPREHRFGDTIGAFAADDSMVNGRTEEAEKMASNGINLNMPGIPIIDGREVREVMIRGAHVTPGGVLVLDTDDGSGRGPVHVVVTPPNLGPLLAVVAETLTRLIRPGPPPPGVMPPPGALRVG